MGVSGPSPFAECSIAVNDPFNDLEVEPYVAVDPLNTRHLVGAWIQDFARGIVAAVSFDSGNTWQSVVIPGVTVCSGGIYPHASDPWVSFAPNGDVYLSLGGHDMPPSGNPNAVLVSKSTDGGLTWGAPTTIVTGTGNFDRHDKYSVTADPTSSQLAYATWARFGSARVFTMFSRTTDGGQNWTPLTDRVTDPVLGPVPAPIGAHSTTRRPTRASTCSTQSATSVRQRGRRSSIGRTLAYSENGTDTFLALPK